MTPEVSKKRIVLDEREELNSLPFADFKESLGSLANLLTDEVIEEMRVTFDRFADVFFDTWLSQKNEHNILKVGKNKKRDERKLKTKKLCRTV